MRFKQSEFACDFHSFLVADLIKGPNSLWRRSDGGRALCYLLESFSKNSYFKRSRDPLISELQKMIDDASKAHEISLNDKAMITLFFGQLLNQESWGSFLSSA
jgi:hypothetical protein